MRFAGARARIDHAMSVRLIEICEQVEDDDGARILAITGSGGAFCRGADDGIDSRMVESLGVVSKPTIAIINGDAIDEGLELAMAADVRIAVASARLALTQLKRGLIPSFGGTQRLPRLIGASRALQMMLTGEAITGVNAQQSGLVAYVARNHRELGAKSAALLSSLLSRAPWAARLVKDAVLKGYDMTLDQGVRLEEDLYALLQTTADRAEGVRAFLEKRKPLFRGA
jgi:enoyl-CoA hydratase